MKIWILMLVLLAAACVREVPVQTPAPKKNWGEYFVSKFKDQLPKGTTCEDWPLAENSVLCVSPTRILWCHAPKEKPELEAKGPSCSVSIDWTPQPPQPPPSSPDPKPEAKPEPPPAPKATPKK